MTTDQTAADQTAEALDDFAAWLERKAAEYDQQGTPPSGGPVEPRHFGASSAYGVAAREARRRAEELRRQ